MKRTDPEYIKGSDNVVAAIITGRSKYGIKCGTLEEFSDDHTAVERSLIKYQNGYRWRRGGMVFGHYFHDVKFITEAEAQDFEKKLRAEFKVQNSR